MQNGNQERVRSGCGWTVTFVLFLLIMGGLLTTDQRVVTLARCGRRLSWYARREREREDTSSSSDDDDENEDEFLQRTRDDTARYHWSEHQQPSLMYENNSNAMHEVTNRIWGGAEGFTTDEPAPPNNKIRRVARVTRTTTAPPHA